MYRYKYQLQNVWPSDGAIIQEVSYYKSIVPCAKWGFLVKSNQEGASQIRLERLDHYYEAFPTIERGQREDNDVTGRRGTQITSVNLNTQRPVGQLFRSRSPSFSVTPT